MVKRYWVDEVLDAAYSGSELDSQVVSILYAVIAQGASLDPELPPRKWARGKLIQITRRANSCSISPGRPWS
jgi:hypothetical protein